MHLLSYTKDMEKELNGLVYGFESTKCCFYLVLLEFNRC